MPRPHSSFQVVIIGAGPAGLSAAKVAAENGLKVAVIDEFPTPGGRMLGQFHEEPGQGWWIGRDVAADLIERVHALGVSVLCGTAVHGLEQVGDKWLVLVAGQRIEADYLLLATGASEVPSPLPGWTLPGVMSIGAAQVMTNVHYVRPGNRGVVIGVNVLAMAISRELAVSGVQLAGIVLPPATPFSQDASVPYHVFQTLARLSHLAPSPLLNWGGRLTQRLHLSKWVLRFLPKRGIKVWDIPLQLRTAAVRINGEEKVESVTLINLHVNGQPIEGSERDIAVDFVAIAGGLSPLVELASVAGCPFTYIPELGGYIPEHHETLRTPVSRLYVAGNITGVESAQVAMSQGRLAATAICEDAGLLGEHAHAKMAAARHDVASTRDRAIISFHPDIVAARQAQYQLS